MDDERNTPATPEDAHPARPEQTEHGFDEGLGDRPRPPAQRRVGSFGDGLADEPPGKRRRRRFSEGLEDPDSPPDERVERRFSEGLERDESAPDRPTPADGATRPTAPDRSDAARRD
jgi:hypothetical protein